jgi:hypothetical protein
MVAVRVAARRAREGVPQGGYRPLFSAQEQREGPLANVPRMRWNLLVIHRSGKPGAYAVGALGTAAECSDMLFAAGCDAATDHLAAPVLTLCRVSAVARAGCPGRG